MQTISDFVTRLAAEWGTYLGGIITLSAFGMAIQQTAKDLLPIRRMFHRRHLRKWFEFRCPTPELREKAASDLIALATDGDAKAFFDLATEQLAGQLSAAAQVALDFPGQHASLLSCLTATKPDALGKLQQVPGSLNRHFEGLKRQAGTETSPELEELATAKMRMAHQIQRSIDAFQISALYRWKTGFQLASFAVCVVIAFLATQGGWPHRIGIGLVAGFFAPVARDLQAKLQQVK
jgi:hypothetical protein